MREGATTLASDCISHPLSVAIRGERGSYNGEAGQKEYLAALAKDVTGVLKEMDLPGWAQAVEQFFLPKGEQAGHLQ